MAVLMTTEFHSQSQELFVQDSSEFTFFGRSEAEGSHWAI